MKKFKRETDLPKSMLGWWLVPDTHRLANGDGREAKVGETHSVAGTIRACSNGLHASPRLKSTLKLCPSSSTQMYLVRLSGDLDGDNWQEEHRSYEKVAARHRTYLGHITIRDAVRDIILRLIKLGITEQNARIKAYGKRAGFKPLPRPIIQFAKDGVITEAFTSAISASEYDTDPWWRLREAIKILTSSSSITHKVFEEVVSMVADQFAFEKNETWALCEYVVEKLMAEQVKQLPKQHRAALPRPRTRRK